MINCFKDSIHVLMSVLLSTNDDDDHDAHQEVVDHADGHRNDEVREEEDGQIVGDTLTLKSSLRKADSNKEEKKVQWVDVMGIKELAEIREFEPSEEDDIDCGRGKTCFCVIL
ncbi:hypothetical protein EUTSA_v10011881mg [Eutrema salsugineum]|uniref:Uncharacterized protein n=1 Tax=Eutrema salsugineum TaxID=72664 RepID=V4KJ44_EUTSA|nr:uncharacterized protein LOC18011304 isoform X2 [Eutrema salsugineum]ESQ29922.1 hypothetical protein EUTSA_v10011881mg [Eutrema salsugineum]